jgi:NADH-quinone oxidoreductase subunit H
MFALTFALLNWVIVPFSLFTGITDYNLGIIFFLAISSLSIYGVFFSGWASNSKYALFGAIRSISQMISYELPLSICLLPIVVLTGSFNLREIVYSQKSVWNIVTLLPLAIIFFICILAETNRTPFDLPEAEAEIVAGYNVEYSSITFAMFFLGEYSNMLFNSTVFVILFLGGWLPFINYFFSTVLIFNFVLKILFITFLYVLVRANLPRYRFDQLLTLSWKKLLPLTLSFFLFVLGFLNVFKGFPFSTEFYFYYHKYVVYTFL